MNTTHVVALLTTTCCFRVLLHVRCTTSCALVHLHFRLVTTIKMSDVRITSDYRFQKLSEFFNVVVADFNTAKVTERENKYDRKGTIAGTQSVSSLQSVRSEHAWAPRRATPLLDTLPIAHQLPFITLAPVYDIGCAKSGGSDEATWWRGRLRQRGRTSEAEDADG